MELRHIKYFLTLSEELHFRRAAEKLFIAQPALTRQIKDLEQELGTVLFKRDKRNVSLTTAGRFLQQEGYQLLKKVETIKDSIADMGSTLNGVVNIGCIGSDISQLLPALILEMAEQFPKVKTNIMEATTLNLLNQLQDGQIDILIGRPHQKVNSIHSEKILEDTTVLVTAAHNKWGINQSSQIADLVDIPFILYPRSAGIYFRDQIIGKCAHHGFYPQIKHESINAFSILKLVEKDIGIAIIPKSIAHGYNLNVNYFKIKELSIPLDMVVSYRTDLEHELPKTITQMIKKLSSEAG